MFVNKIEAKLNAAEACLVRVSMPSGDVVVAIAIDDFLVTTQNNIPMNEFYDIMEKNYNEVQYKEAGVATEISRVARSLQQRWQYST